MRKLRLLQGCGCSMIATGVVVILVAVVMVVAVAAADRQAGQENEAQWESYRERMAEADSLANDTIQAPRIRQGGMATLLGVEMAIVVGIAAGVLIVVGCVVLRIRRRKLRSMGVLLILLLLMACQERTALPEGNSVYYWRTDLRLDSTERAFLKLYNINKVYCRYFDVVMRDGQPMPNATITFNDTLPEGVEVVPTVYITADVFEGPASDGDRQLASQLVERIRQMNETNDIRGVSELQIDYDYSLRTRQRYYDFLQAIRQNFSLLTSHFSLSATIRLHQLSMEAPPVDYGALMVYNTGDPRRFQERNPVLDKRDVEPYLRYVADYPLPLATAYPVYKWVRNYYGVRLEHEVAADEILQVKHALEQRREDLSRQLITYHLDKDNINRYNSETYEEIYHH